MKVIYSSRSNTSNRRELSEAIAVRGSTMPRIRDEGSTSYFRVGNAQIYSGDCLKVLPELPESSVDAVVTDPPYELGFMSKYWDDTGVAFDPVTWELVLRVLKPGGYMLSFGGTRTYHRLACAVEDAGFEIRDCVMWLYGSGFPKGKGCLKPAYETILLCRKSGAKVLPLGIDECRIPINNQEREIIDNRSGYDDGIRDGIYGNGVGKREVGEKFKSHKSGRWPANVCHDGSEEVLEAFAEFGESKSIRNEESDGRQHANNKVYGDGKGWGRRDPSNSYSDTGTAARFYYCAKASKSERGEGNTHPTVKPLKLMEWLVKLVCSEGGFILDPFCGSGSTGVAALNTGRKFLGIEKTPEYAEIIKARLERAIPSSSPPSTSSSIASTTLFD